MGVGHLGFRGRVESAANSLQAHTKDLAQFSNAVRSLLTDVLELAHGDEKQRR